VAEPPDQTRARAPRSGPRPQPAGSGGGLGPAPRGRRCRRHRAPFRVRAPRPGEAGGDRRPVRPGRADGGRPGLASAALPPARPSRLPIRPRSPPSARPSATSGRCLRPARRRPQPGRPRPAAAAGTVPDPHPDRHEAQASGAETAPLASAGCRSRGSPARPPAGVRATTISTAPPGARPRLPAEARCTQARATPDAWAVGRQGPGRHRSTTVLRCESVVMSNHPTHRHQLPGGGVPHEASFVGTSGGPGRTRSRGAGFLLCTPRSRLRGDPRSPREAGFAGTPRCRRVPSNAGSYRGPHEASLVGSPYLGSTGPSATDGEHE
jgi:hypothetical protein